jgi:hypothetical protein
VFALRPGLLQLHRLSSTLVQATTYSQSLSNLQLLVGFIHAHRHAQDVLRQHIRVSWILVCLAQGREQWVVMLICTAVPAHQLSWTPV